MEELLSLKWNNHRSEFYHLLTTLRKQELFSDVTLACDGRLYNAHRMVLATCSDYFSNIFKSLNFEHTVIVLKDISCENLESLLDYMYVGEVNVSQSSLASLIKAAENLKLKGLSVVDNNHTNLPESSGSNKRHESPTSTKNKRIKTFHGTTPCTNDSSVIKCESSSENLFPLTMSDTPNMIKEEASVVDQYENKWEIDEDDPEGLTAQNSFCTRDPLQYPGSSTDFPLESDTFTGYTINGQSLISHDNISPFRQKTLNRHGRYQCSYCSKCFYDQWYLTRHIRTHTGEKPFGCSHCPHKTSRKDKIYMHMAQVHRDFSKRILLTEDRQNANDILLDKTLINS